MRATTRRWLTQLEDWVGQERKDVLLEYEVKGVEGRMDTNSMRRRVREGMASSFLYEGLHREYGSLLRV